MRSLLLSLAVLVVFALPARGQSPSLSSADPPADPALADTAQAGPPPAFDAPPTGRPLRGVTWRPPADLAQAVRAMQKMKQAGVEALRTPLIRRDSLLEAADTLRLRLFQDLPAAYLSAEGMADALPTLRWELERALLTAQRHPSTRHFGLARRGDTSEPATCEALRDLTERVHASGLEGAATYYDTPFVEEDRCRGTADLTLLNALNDPAPQALLQRWRAASTDTTERTAAPDTSGLAPSDSASSGSARVGIGALGTWMEAGTQGLRAPHSPQSQARYFETHLPPLLGDSLRAQATGRSQPEIEASPDSLRAPAVVFAYRWQDRAAAGEGSAEDPYGRSYGLFGADGAPRPAWRVVRGLYSGEQTVFAFDTGEAPMEQLPWLVLMGWGLVAVVGVFYASAARFRGLVQRYFTSSNFYRDAVHENRDALGVSSLVLLAAISLCSGIVVTVFLLTVQETGPFVQMLRGASGETQNWIFELLQRPWMAILIVALFYFVCLWGWAFFLALATRRSTQLRTSQTLMLVAWSRWPMFILAIAAIVAASLPPGWALPVSGAVVAAWVLAAIVGAVRTLYDLALMADLSPVVTPALVLLNPILLAAIMVFFAVLEFLPEAGYLWHLATRT